MNQEYFSLLTKLGQARIINAQALGKTVKLSRLKVGDGGEDGGKEIDPKETDTALVREKWQGPINSIFQDPNNDNWLVAETVIPEGDGNFYITEFGLYDEDDNLIAIGKYPKTYKPTLAQGSGSSLYIRVIFELSNTATVELKIDPAVVLASRSYVESLLQKSFSQMPVPAEILTDNNRLQVVLGNQKFTITPNQLICWRGWKHFNTSDYSESERQFLINANNTYHLRWTPLSGFQLKDLSDNHYNPSGLADQDLLFNTTYDDVLIGKIDNGEYYPAIIATKRLYRPQMIGSGELRLPLGYRDLSFRILLTCRDHTQKSNISLPNGESHFAYLNIDGSKITPSGNGWSKKNGSGIFSSNDFATDVCITTITGDIVGDELYLQTHQSEHSYDPNQNDEELFSMGVRKLTATDFQQGLPLKYEAIESASLVFEVF